MSKYNISEYNQSQYNTSNLSLNLSDSTTSMDADTVFDRVHNLLESLSPVAVFFFLPSNLRLNEMIISSDVLLKSIPAKLLKDSISFRDWLTVEPLPQNPWSD